MAFFTSEIPTTYLAMKVPDMVKYSTIKKKPRKATASFKHKTTNDKKT